MQVNKGCVQIPELPGTNAVPLCRRWDALHCLPPPMRRCGPEPVRTRGPSCRLCRPACHMTWPQSARAWKRAAQPSLMAAGGAWAGGCGAVAGALCTRGPAANRVCRQRYLLYTYVTCCMQRVTARGASGLAIWASAPRQSDAHKRSANIRLREDSEEEHSIGGHAPSKHVQRPRMGAQDCGCTAVCASKRLGAPCTWLALC